MPEPVPNPVRPQLVFPDNLADWPWPRAINPHYQECKAASEAWIRTFNAFGPKAQKVFDKCDFSMSRFVSGGMAYLTVLRRPFGRTRVSKCIQR